MSILDGENHGYIEYEALVDSLTDRHAIRYVYDLEKKKKFTGNWYAKGVTIDNNQDIFDYICDNQ